MFFNKKNVTKSQQSVQRSKRNYQCVVLLLNKITKIVLHKSMTLCIYNVINAYDHYKNVCTTLFFCLLICWTKKQTKQKHILVFGQIVFNSFQLFTSEGKYAIVVVVEMEGVRNNSKNTVFLLNLPELIDFRSIFVVKHSAVSENWNDSSMRKWKSMVKW